MTTIIVLVFCIQYGACVVLFQANERRAMVELIEKSARLRAVLKIGGWCLLIFSMFLCASLQGWERGVPVWLCLIAVAGFLSLYVSAYKPIHHIRSGIATLAVSALLGIGSLLVDGSVDTAIKNVDNSVKNIETSKKIAQYASAKSTTI